MRGGSNLGDLKSRVCESKPNLIPSMCVFVCVWLLEEGRGTE